MVLHFKTIPRLIKSDNVDSFQDPRPKPKKKVMFEDSTTVVPLFEYKEAADKTSESTSSASHSSHQKKDFSPHSPSSSPPAQLSSREKLVSPTTEDHTAQRHPAFIWPQDVNTQHTTALIQETSPLAPYKIQRLAKRKARQAFSTMR